MIVWHPAGERKADQTQPPVFPVISGRNCSPASTTILVEALRSVEGVDVESGR